MIQFGKDFFIFSATDPEGDYLYYYVDWGDETGKEMIGPFPSGEEQTVAHTWSENGEYTIKVKTMDTYQAESDYGSLEVTMPKTKTFDHPFLRFLEHHPHLFPLLRMLFDL